MEGSGIGVGSLGCGDLGLLCRIDGFKLSVCGGLQKRFSGAEHLRS